MKRGRLLLLALGLSLLSGLSAADERGSRSCRKWAEERRLAEGRKDMNKVPVLISKAWFLGYLSGQTHGAKSDPLAGIDNESIFLWLDNYCRDHAQHNLADAGLALQRELKQDKGR